MLVIPIIETERLLLRPIAQTDFLDVYEYASNPLVGPNAGWKPHQNILESKAFIQYCTKKREFGQPGNYAIVLKSNQKMIGTIEVHSYKEHKGEIGFVLNPDYWNKGIITEASKAIIIYAFEVLHLKRLAYSYFPFNERSKRVCEKLGFFPEGLARKKYLNYEGTPLDEFISSITDDDYYGGKLAWLEQAKRNISIHL